MTTPEQEDPGQYATPEEIEDLEATAEDQENVTGGWFKLTGGGRD